MSPRPTCESASQTGFSSLAQSYTICHLHAADPMEQQVKSLRSDTRVGHRRLLDALSMIVDVCILYVLPRRA